MDRQAIAAQLEQCIINLNRLRDQVGAKSQAKIAPQRVRSIIILYIEGKNRLKDLASKLGVSTSSLCIAFNHLEQEGLVQREIDPQDRRNTYYSLTTKGLATAQQLILESQQAITELLAQHSTTETQALGQAAQTINDIMKQWYLA